jgi:hypothetical protein
VTIFNECASTDANDVDITITGPETRTVNTGDDIEACFEDIKPGHYTITTHKEGCATPSGEVDIACGDDKSINLGYANCSEGALFTFDIFGCASNPLPGAVCTLSGAVSGSATTDASGHAEIPITATGSVAWSVSHPSGRFNSASGSKTVSDLCEDSEVGVAFSLSPADGYACCFPFLGGFPDNPYPISTSLLWTDCTGEYEFDIDPVGCGQDICTSIELDDVSLDGPSSCVTCTGGGTKQFPPTDIGVHPINVLLSLNLGSIAANIIRYYYRTYTGLSVKFFNYKTGAVCPDCGADDASRSWRVNDTCDALETGKETGGIQYEIRASVSYVVNSVIPFNLTSTINPAGNGYGPGDPFTSWSGEPPCATVVISEIP